MKKPLLLILLCITLFNIACQKEPEPSRLNPAVEHYLSSILAIMEVNSINRKTIDWVDFKKNVLAAAEGAKEINDTKTNDALQLALTQLKDAHSFFVTGKGVYIPGIAGPACNNSDPVIPAADKEIGYIKVGTFSGTHSKTGLIPNSSVWLPAVFQLLI